MTFEKMKVRIHNYHIPKNLSADGLDDRIMLSHSARQNKGSMVQVFTQKDRHIIYSSSNIPTYIYACIHWDPSYSAKKWRAVSEQGSSNSALWSVETFFCWVTAECGNWPWGGFIVRQTQMKAQKHSALCVCASVLDLTGLVDIYSVPSFKSQTGRGQGAAQPSWLFIFSIFFCLLIKNSVVHRLNS